MGDVKVVIKILNVTNRLSTFHRYMDLTIKCKISNEDSITSSLITSARNRTAPTCSKILNSGHYCYIFKGIPVCVAKLDGPNMHGTNKWCVYGFCSRKGLIAIDVAC